MFTPVNVAILGCTGYVGIELIKILSNHPNVKINFLGSKQFSNKSLGEIDNRFAEKNLPRLTSNENFDPLKSDVVFLSLPHGISNKYIKTFFGKIKIIDLSADFRLDDIESYLKTYEDNHIGSELIKNFTYGLTEINKIKIKKSSNIAVPGCYPTSILLPLIPLIRKNFINTKNIIIDSKSGYSGAGKNFDLKKINDSKNYNFYNYNTNNHRHSVEILQELNKSTKDIINLSFNPHILPIFRGMMSTIYCDLNPNVTNLKVKSELKKFYNESYFVKILENKEIADFYTIQNTNFCKIKLFKHHSKSKIIIVSVIDNLLKGAAGQAVQCFNLMSNLDEKISIQ